MAFEKRKTAFWFLILFLAEYFYVLHGFGGVNELNGDSLCQIGYWKILSRPWLQGTLAASATKPGQVLVLGALHQFFSAIALRAALAAFGAGLALTLGFIAADIGGAAAGLCAAFFTVGAFSDAVFTGESTLFMLPFLFGGLRLYYYRAPEMRKWGLLLLALAPLFRIEAVSAVLVVLLVHLLKKEWKALAAGTAALAASLGVWLAFLFRIQGDVSRFGSGHGYYVKPVTTFFVHLAGELRGSLFYYSTMLPLVLCLIGIVGVCFVLRKYRAYLIALSPLAIVFVTYVFLVGLLATRYFATTFALGISVGTGFLFAFFRRPLPPALRKAALALGAAFILGAGAVFYVASVTRLVSPVPAHVFIADGQRLAAEDLIPDGSRILTEDDALYVLLMNDPDRFRRLYPLQWFNVADDAVRARILGDTDYVYIFKGKYPWYYLCINESTHRQDLQADRFWGYIQQAMKKGSRTELYGVTLTPLVNDEKRLILKVGRPAAAAARGGATGMNRG